MENNKSQFKRTGVLYDGVECIEIQISHSGDAERNDIRGTVSSEADFRSDTYSGTKFNN